MNTKLGIFVVLFVLGSIAIAGAAIGTVLWALGGTR